MRNKARVLLLLAILLQPAPATLILYEHSQAEVLLGVDSLESWAWPDGSLTSSKKCKVHQNGNTFWTFSGILDVELYAIAKRAAESASGAAEIARAFDLAARPVLERLFAERLAARYGPQFGAYSGAEGLDLIIVDKAGVLVHLQYSTDAGPSLAPLVLVYDAGKQAGPPIAMGAAGFFEQVDTSDRGPGLDRMLARFESQIAYDDGRLARGKRARVGGPVSILRIAGGKAAWVEGYQGACPAL